MPEPTKDIVYFDLETKRTANDAGGWDKQALMGMSIGVTYSTKLDAYKIYTDSEEDVNTLVQQLLRADLVVGFNLVKFDYEVLMGYTPYDLPSLVPTLDLLLDLTEKIGHRIGLDAVSQSTLGIGKTGDGLDAIKWWREGRILEIAEYCCYDVKATKLVHEYGCLHKKVFYHDRAQQKRTVPVTW